MQHLDGRLLYSASDLNDYLECKRLTDLEALVAHGAAQRPDWEDEQTKLIRRKGEEHELAHLESLRQSDANGIVEFQRGENSIEAYRRAEQETLAAMRTGARVIYQATFFDGQFLGRADFLRRVERPSNLGGHSYEAMDTKLGLHAKPYYLVQLCNYSEHLERLQGRMPEFGHVLLGNGIERRFRLHDFMAYYRRLKATFLTFAAETATELLDEARTYPLECKHCEICAWNASCEQRRRDDDHLSLVASVRRDQIAKLQAATIADVKTLAEATDNRRPAGMSPETFVKLRRQAALQVHARTAGEPVYELLRHDPGLGFELLPAPDPGDAFFDMEGDPIFEPGRSLEYLFGCWLPGDEPEFRAFWGLDRDQEKRAFERLVDFIVERRRRHPAMHVYHYANYEKEALRRLAQQHCTREVEVDDLLRGEVLVDLFAVVRRAIAVGEESYSLKNLERFYDLARETIVKKGNESIVMFETWRTGGDREILEDIERYNRDDCRSTYLLREWLVDRRSEAMALFGIELPFRPQRLPDEPCHAEPRDSCKTCVKRQSDAREEARRSDLERLLLAGVLAPHSEEEYRLMAADRRMRYLLGNLLAYHRREEKPAWWAYFDRCENVDELLEFDKEAIGGLTLCSDVAPRAEKRSFVYTYEFPDQPYKLGAGDEAVDPRTKKGGTIVALDLIANRLEFKTTASLDEARGIKELIPGGPPSTKEQRDALARIAAAFLAGTLPQEYPATHDLLSGTPPRLRGLRICQPDEVSAESVSAVVAALDRSYLFIQGPPGSGKSTVGSHVICDLLAAGKRVAVTSLGHKSIHNLLGKVEECMAARGRTFRGGYKYSKRNPGSEYRSAVATPFIESVDSNEAFDGDTYQLVGGTAWLFARKELGTQFDYLFIDEAGQVALADALATSLCARNVVLLGDPSQLAQVSQGRHPLHADDSILQHLLAEAPTVPKESGIFLNRSYRMQPAICEFVSDAMYEGRLHAGDSTGAHRIAMPGSDVAGLYWMPIEHEGNGSSSVEEAKAIVAAVGWLRERGTVVDSRAGIRDAIVVTPYNAQRRLILDRLRDANLTVDVGTVDKFQGQEAAVVFYSMATSSGEDVPRNVEFLFERNRFNVAISRARAASVLVCSPRLLDIACRTPEQMALANLLCAYAERARPLRPTAAITSL
ncbi:MAG TPA: TM0106 family RecB-like putative nuclease [Candidatus Cybelea sp.]|jgi:uncharacterized protein|nr:TM0106 family RecB-like putative nuclease [Candidatus Cybelea sp.]